jgi:hypothetical protein
MDCQLITVVLIQHVSVSSIFLPLPGRIGLPDPQSNFAGCDSDIGFVS